MTIAPHIAAQELLDRRAARSSLISFASQVDIPGAPVSEDEDEGRFQRVETNMAAHHRLLLSMLQHIAETPSGRGMVFMPPGSAKSTYSSVVFPAWLMGKNPKTQIILASYATGLAKKHGRRARQLVSSPRYRQVFDTVLSSESSAANEWALTNGSEYMAGGLQSGLTGNRADGLIIDDPVAGREEAESEVLRAKTLAAYEDDARTRIKPNGWRIVVACMTGDTRVLRADGSETLLKNIRIGDRIATHEDGEITTSSVLNWINHGPDSVFEITTSSGISVRANARHPFLVGREGATEWVRLRNLKIGDRLVGASGAERCARPMTATSQPKASASARRTTTSTNGPPVTALLLSILNHVEKRICATATGLVAPSTSLFSKLREAAAQFATRVLSLIQPRIGHAGCYALTTATIPASFAGYSATTATSWSGADEPRKTSFGALNTCEITAITEAGVEDVYDIQVARTENFIANGLVSHNTRWHESDLCGQILPENWNGESGPVACRDGHVWEVICLPAEADRADDPLGRKMGEGLWPEWFTKGHWDEFKAKPRSWLSLYQQKPTAEQGTYFKREWFDPHRYTKRPEELTIYMTADFAVSEDKGDWTEIAVWGVDPQNDVYALDWWYGQATADAWINALLTLVAKHKPIWLVAESGVIRKAVEPFLRKEMEIRHEYVATEWLATVGDKPAMARSFQAMASVGKVHFPYVEWAERALSQLMKFPAGSHDDIVDTCGLLGRFIDQTYAANRKPAPKVIHWDAPLTIRDFEPRMQA